MKNIYLLTKRIFVFWTYLQCKNIFQAPFDLEKSSWHLKWFSKITTRLIQQSKLFTGLNIYERLTKNSSTTVHIHSNPLLTRICVHQLPIGIPPTAFRVWQMDHTESDLWLICPTEILSFFRLAVKKRNFPLPCLMYLDAHLPLQVSENHFWGYFDVRLFQILPDVSGDITKYLMYWFFNSFFFFFHEIYFICLLFSPLTE